MKHTFIFKTAGIVLSLGALHTLHGADVQLRHSDRPHARGPYTLVSDPIQNEIVKDVLDDCKAEGRAEGLEEGRAEGLKEGRAEGLKEGRAEGIADLIRSGFVSYDVFMGSDHYSDELKARVTLLLKPAPQ